MHASYSGDLDRVAAALGDAQWLRGKRVLITGACGMIGSCLADLLARLDERGGLGLTLMLNDRSPERLERRFGNLPRAALLAQDITRPLVLPEPVDLIIHAASFADPASFSARPVEVMQANLGGAQQLLELLRHQGHGRLVYVSSGEVYGDSEEQGAFVERDSGYVDPVSPRACYPSAKRAAETLCASYHHEYGVDALIARPCHTYGQTMTPTDSRAASEFLRRAAAGEPIILRSEGAQVRNYCYVADMAAGLLCLAARGEAGQAYNIAPENAVVSIRDLARTIARLGGCGFETRLSPDAAPAPIRRGVLDSRKIRALGWSEQFTLEEAVGHVLACLREQQEDTP